MSVAYVRDDTIDLLYGQDSKHPYPLTLSFDRLSGYLDLLPVGLKLAGVMEAHDCLPNNIFTSPVYKLFRRKLQLAIKMDPSSTVAACRGPSMFEYWLNGEPRTTLLSKLVNYSANPVEKQSFVMVAPEAQLLAIPSLAERLTGEVTRMDFLIAHRAFLFNWCTGVYTGGVITKPMQNFVENTKWIREHCDTSVLWNKFDTPEALKAQKGATIVDSLDPIPGSKLAIVKHYKQPVVKAKPGKIVKVTTQQPMPVPVTPPAPAVDVQELKTMVESLLSAQQKTQDTLAEVITRLGRIATVEQLSNLYHDIRNLVFVNKTLPPSYPKPEDIIEGTTTSPAPKITCAEQQPVNPTEANGSQQ